jgi:hypothetical protein
MDSKQLTMLMAERTALHTMIASTPEEDVIDRGSLQAKLEQVEALIALGSGARSPAKVRLTFRGRPVVGTQGIYADFSMRAVHGFTEAIAAVAASLTAPLRPMGPIPNREQNQLLITSTALGSFGFELEELPVAQATPDEPSLVEQALEKTQAVLTAAVQEDDDALADSAWEIDQRAVDKIRGFVETLQANEALCTIEFKTRHFRFANGKEVARTIERMSAANLQETNQSVRGSFVGALPYKRRTFEFRIEGSAEVIVGRFGPNVNRPEEINRHIEHPCAAQFAVTRVGQGKPRYILLEMPRWVDGEASS